MGDWLRSTPIWLLGVLLLIAAVGSAYAGAWFSRWLAHLRGEGGTLSDTQQGYVVSSAIEVLYLKAQLLDEPHRSRFANLLVWYTGNHLELARLRHDDASAQRLLAEDDSILRDIWTATVPAFQSVKTLDYSTSFVDSVADLVRVDAERKALRRSQIPATILVALVFYMLIAAAVLGGVMKTRKGRQFSIALLALNILALMLVADINRPVEGTIHESQEPMQRMLARLKANPPIVYQRLALRPNSGAHLGPANPNM